VYCFQVVQNAKISNVSPSRYHRQKNMRRQYLQDLQKTNFRDGIQNYVSTFSEAEVEWPLRLKQNIFLF